MHEPVPPADKPGMTDVLRAVFIALAFAAFTLPLMPYQWLLLKWNRPAARTFPHWYHRMLARLAGMPAAVVNHARHALERLEQQQVLAREQVDLFEAPPEAVQAGPSAVEAALGQLEPDTMTPREALDALYALKKKLERS